MGCDSDECTFPHRENDNPNGIVIHYEYCPRCGKTEIESWLSKEWVCKYCGMIWPRNRERSMEKHYIIREWGQTDPPKGWDVTESELIRRLNIICDEMHSPKKSIDILLHGEQKEKP